MAYEKQTWKCGETISADKLNHMEDGIANAGGDCDCGYECTETKVSLFDGSVTTESDDPKQPGAIGDVSAYTALEEPPIITVTFNGTQYICEPLDGQFAYGAEFNPETGLDWSTYPFSLMLATEEGNPSMIATQTAGTYTIKIEMAEETVMTTPCFEKARGYSCVDKYEPIISATVTTEDNGQGVITASLPYTELIDSENLSVVWNGTTYECALTEEDGIYRYGAPLDEDTSSYDWSEFPFAINSQYDAFASVIRNNVYTQNAGTYNIAISGSVLTAEVSDCFKLAVEQITKPLVNSPVVLHASKPPADATSSSPSYIISSVPFIAESIKKGGAIVDDGNNLYSIIWVGTDSVLIGGVKMNTTSLQNELVTYEYALELGSGLRYPPNRIS